jgi:hypothetical protein
MCYRRNVETACTGRRQGNVFLTGGINRLANKSNPKITKSFHPSSPNGAQESENFLNMLKYFQNTASQDVNP